MASTTSQSATPKITRQSAYKRGRKRALDDGCTQYGQRSSLRRAIRESLRDVSASIPVPAAAAGADALTTDVVVASLTPSSSMSLSPKSQHHVPLLTSSPHGSSSLSHSSLGSSVEQQDNLSPASGLVSTPGPAPLLTPLSSFSSTTSASTVTSSFSSSTSSSPSSIATPPTSFSPPSSFTTASGSFSASTPRSNAKRKKRASAAPADVAKGLLQDPESSPSRRRGNRGGWHTIKEIVGEGRERGSLVYLVEWEGSDPNTGVMWPCSWVDAKNVNNTAIQEWEARKTGETLS